MSRKDAINQLFLKRPEPSASAPHDSVARNTDRVRTGAVAAMGASLQEMAENAKQASQLRQQLAEGDAVVALDPKKIDHSKIADRIPTEVDPAFDQLVASIRETGQQVPILVRPSPTAPGRFQIAYGRRRLRAAEHLGQSVLAIVRELSDRDLVIAQGRENLDRTDLSFIEKAFFAMNLEDDGCDRATIVAALASDKADISRYIAIARRVPDTVVKRIGPAPKAGRARWQLMADALATPSNAQRVVEILDGVASSVDSDTRFEVVLRGLLSSATKKQIKRVDTWKTPQGRKGVHVEERDGKTALVFENKVVLDFGKFVSSQLDDLYRRFLNISGKGEET